MYWSISPHHRSSHRKCFTLRENIMTLVRIGKIIIDNGETAETNHASVKLDNDLISEVLRRVTSPKIEEDVITCSLGAVTQLEFLPLRKQQTHLR